MSYSTLVLSIGGGGSLLLLLIVFTLFLHKKFSSTKLHVIGALGVTETHLDPEGAIIVNGELWRARSNNGTRLQRAAKIRVIGTLGHLLVVESAPD